MSLSLMNPSTSDEERYWQALVSRDAAFDGVVYFGVRSTGIYCRPTCPARKPRREHVAFFPTSSEAERAGFRPCLRCKPRELAHDPKRELVARACAFIDSQQDEPVTLTAISLAVGCSQFHLQRTFKECMGVSPRQYAAARRIERFKAALRDGADVTRATYDAGFGSSSRLYEEAGSELGMTPATYRNGGAGVTITCAIVSTDLGYMLVARTVRGVCAVRLGDDPGELEAGLAAEYPHSRIERDDAALQAIVDQIVASMNGSAPAAEFPLDIRATAFQRRVWEALRAIPFGEVRTYGEIAKAIGQPGASRAVGRACATNPIALAIPCHRVVSVDRALAGYRWGVERKQQLLQLEQRHAVRSAQSIDTAESS